MLLLLIIGNIDEEEIMGVMKLFEEVIPRWSALEGYLNLYNYSKALKSVPGCGRDDGIHFEPVCNYQVFFFDITLFCPGDNPYDSVLSEFLHRHLSHNGILIGSCSFMLL